MYIQSLGWHYLKKSKSVASGDDTLPWQDPDLDREETTSIWRADQLQARAILSYKLAGTWWRHTGIPAARVYAAVGKVCADGAVWVVGELVQEEGMVCTAHVRGVCCEAELGEDLNSIFAPGV